jgi:ribose transport system substrate-binding protein
VAIAMDYTRQNLDLVKDGEMYAVVGQPLWDESYGAAQLLKKMAAGQKVDYWTKQDAPVITKADLDKYYKMLDDAAAMMKAPAPAQPTAAPAAAAAPVNKGTKYYWIQLLKGHPVHQLTQAAFLTGCKAKGMDCQVVGPDEADVQKAVAAAEQVLAKGDAAGVSIWTGGPQYLDVIKKFEAAGVPVVAPHFAVPEGTWPKNTVIIGTDPAIYAANAAKAICAQVGKDKKGTVALTQGSFNTTENLVSESFTKTMAQECPSLKVLKPEEEGFDPPKAIAKAVAIMQANPDIVAAMSTTGGGPTTWAGAQKETGQKIVAIAMDYTRQNLDLVKDGEMYAVVGQPLWDESFGAADLLLKMHNGEKVDYWTKQDAPVITKADLDKYYKMLDDAAAMMK